VRRSHAVLVGEQLQFVVTVEAADGPAGVRDLGAVFQRVALELRRSWNEQFPTERVIEVTVAGAKTDYSISFDVPLGGSGAHD
jgi:hypothetical protein